MFLMLFFKEEANGNTAKGSDEIGSCRKHLRVLRRMRSRDRCASWGPRKGAILHQGRPFYLRELRNRTLSI